MAFVHTGVCLPLHYFPHGPTNDGIRGRLVLIYSVLTGKNHIGHSKKQLSDTSGADLIDKLEQRFKNKLNLVQADPFDFTSATKRVDQKTGKIS